jgi:phage terminase large subunit
MSIGLQNGTKKTSMPLSDPQKEVISSNKRFRVLITGRRFGKTHVCMIEILRKAMRCNNGKIFYVSPTYRMSKEIMWKQLKKKIKELRWQKYINETELTIVLKNNCQISLKGADKSYDNLRGVGLNFLVMDEFADINELAWSEVLRPTISDKHVKGSVLFVGTPKGFGNWSYEMYQKGQSGDPEWSSWRYTTLDGGQVEPHEIEQAKKDLDERSFRQEYLASFETYSGVVYYNFDRLLNVKPIKYDQESIIHVGLDMNIDPMSACLFQLKNGVAEFFDEIVIYSSNTGELVDELLTRYPLNKIIVYPDPACTQRKTSAGGRTDLTILQNSGLNVKCKHTHALVRDRINSVNARLKNFDGNRNIMIDPSCKNLINSLTKQMYKEGTNQPEKSGYDHMTDAIGYAIEYIFPITSNTPPSQPKRFS